MDYRVTITISKAMSECVAHVEVVRENASGWLSKPLYQRTEILPEEAHPEPEKWARAHMLMLAEYL